jgi:ATP-dependent exoDNAse (exonuclease V) alpha subunit
MTIHKAQGQSCPYLEVNLNGCGMNAGQAYTALSRATSAKTMRVKSFHKVIEQVRADPRVINFLRQLERL